MIPRYRPPFSFLEGKDLLFSGKGDPSRLEQAYCEAYGYSHAVWFPYGRVAIRAFLETLETDSKDAVVCGFNCLALGNALRSSGWGPLYVDTEENGFNQDSEDFLEALRLPQAGAGIVVSQWGIPADKGISRKSEKPLLHDFALRGLDFHPMELKESDAVLYSMGWGKPLGALRGAMLLGSSEGRALRWRGWRDARLQSGEAWERMPYLLEQAMLTLGSHPMLFGISLEASKKIPLLRDRARTVLGKSSEGEFPADWNRIPPESVFDSALKRLKERDRLQERRHEQVERYLTGLGTIASSDLLLPPRVRHLSHFPVRTTRREELHAKLLRQGIFSSTELFSKLLPDYPHLTGKVARSLARAQRLRENTLHLPLFHDLSAQEQERVIQAVRRFFQ